MIRSRAGGDIPLTKLSPNQMAEAHTSEGPASGPYRRGRLLRSIVPYAKRARDLLKPGPRLRNFDPLSTLVTEEHPVVAAAYPVVDVHTHLGRWLTPDNSWMAPDKGALLETMERLNLRTLVNLDGRWGDELEANLERYDRANPDRFCTFCQLDFEMLARGAGPDDLVASLERSKRAGAKGLKVWKNLGLTATVDGRLLVPDDPLLGPVWEAAGALELPVLIHVADPVAFFLPVDRHNERIEELLAHPSISQAHHGTGVRDRLMTSFESVVASNPDTQIVGAHVGCFGENLSWVSGMLDRYPNFWIDTAARAELGRQPRAAARLIQRHSERVLFGADVFPVDPDVYRLYFRILETEDEHFRYTATGKHPGEQGRWAVSGLGLRPELLEKLYNRNACRLLGLESPAGGAAQDPTSPPPKVSP
jgi:predicted TIM-barrel fold metal-dependent hydrolase